MLKLRTLIISLLTTALVVPTATAGAFPKHHKLQSLTRTTARSTVACPDADLEPAPGNLGRIRKAVLCLHNQIRAAHHLPLLREHKRLRKAALGHSREMVHDRYFEHTSPSGSTMVERIIKAHYVREDQGWALGENLEWGTGSLATPRGAVDAWMDSPGHRANILQRAFREMGVGVVVGVPVSDARGATYTVDFGMRR